MPTPNLADLYDEHASALFGFLVNFTRHDADARDVLQEVFIKLVRTPGLMDGVRDPRAFLLRLAHNLAIDQGRRRQTRDRYHAESGADAVELFAPAPDPDRRAFQSALGVALAELPPDQRAVVHLKLWEGLTFDRIAEVLEIPLNTAASRYRYGLDKLRVHLRPLYDEIR
ncbi:MAG: RNA polymerase sigma factor [Verrucomicrobiales bacterium]|nr:RNA polymerase sigma factor [Verrucomicrobiales bacterium]